MAAEDISQNAGVAWNGGQISEPMTEVAAWAYAETFVRKKDRSFAHTEFIADAVSVIEGWKNHRSDSSLSGPDAISGVGRESSGTDEPQLPLRLDRAGRTGRWSRWQTGCRRGDGLCRPGQYPVPT